jgi:hypothetical protein
MEGAKKSKLKMTFIILPIALLTMVVSFAYGKWDENKRAQEQVPKLAADSMVKALRQYQRSNGKFPEDLMELEKVVWKHKKVPDFGPQQKTLTVANYYYVYALVDPLTCTVWAIPSGPKREEGSTHFLVIAPQVIRHWKGPALSNDDITKIVSAPTPALLTMLGLTEQEIIDQRTKPKT